MAVERLDGGQLLTGSCTLAPKSSRNLSINAVAHSFSTTLDHHSLASGHAAQLAMPSSPYMTTSQCSLISQAQQALKSSHSTFQKLSTSWTTPLSSTDSLNAISRPTWLLGFLATYQTELSMSPLVAKSATLFTYHQVFLKAAS